MAADCLSCIKCGGANVRHNKRIITADITIDHGPMFFACGRSPSFQIYSGNIVDPVSKKGKVSEKIYLDKVGRKELVGEGRIYGVKFEVDEIGFGRPGALVVENRHHRRFSLRCVTVNSGGEFNIYFDCKSWIYPIKKTNQPRYFFSNASYLPKETPRGLIQLRENELKQLRGDQTLQIDGGGIRQEWERVYNYERYNDLGNPDRGRDFTRPILGDQRLPYPRRLRSDRAPSKQDVRMESSVGKRVDRVYVPPDERFSPEKMSELEENIAKSLWRFLIGAKTEATSRSFKRLDELFEVYEDKAGDNAGGLFSRIKEELSEMFTENNEARDPLDSWMKARLMEVLQLSPAFYHKVLEERTKTPPDVPLPSIVAENNWAFMEDSEFGRQMLAGTNPTRIQLLPKDFFAPAANDGKMKVSAIQKDEIDEILGSSWRFCVETVDKAIEGDMMFILDHHYLLPYLRSINKWEVRAYASRTLLVETVYKILEPVAIELSWFSSNSNDTESQGQPTAQPRVFYNPSYHDSAFHDQALWSLAKLHVASNDAAHHLLVTHWLRTHAVVEPFIIAARRQLSAMHPVHRLLHPHFKDTLHANALARALVINAGGVLETLCFTSEVSMEISSKFYRDWKFDEQALPKDLIKRGMAKPNKHDSDSWELLKVIKKEKLEDPDPEPDMIPEPEEDDSVELVLKDYPYAEDGLEIWTVIKRWVRSYCLVFYTNDESVSGDDELKEWWREVQKEGHPEIKEGWYDIKTQDDLVQALTTLIWICSAMHAAVNYGQYAYAGFPPNRPTILHKLIPEERSDEYNTLDEDFEDYYCQTLPDRFEVGMVAALTHVLSQHPCDKLYLGQRETPDWTDNDVVKLKFDEFGENLKKIEKRILERNRDFTKFNRWGTEAKIPYKLLYPDTSRVDPNASGITWRGIPNSISI